jgi:hypothetical protein
MLDTVTRVLSEPAECGLVVGSAYAPLFGGSNGRQTLPIPSCPQPIRLARLQTRIWKWQVCSSTRQSLRPLSAKQWWEPN